MSQGKEEDIDAKQKKGQKGCFSTALLLNLSPIHNSLLDLNEGVDNLRLNTSASAIQADSSTIMNNCISSDLMNRIDNLSPIKSKKLPINKKISDICLVSCEEGKNLNNDENISSDDNSFQLSCEFQLNEEIKEPNYKKLEDEDDDKDNDNDNPQFQLVEQATKSIENNKAKRDKDNNLKENDTNDKEQKKTDRDRDRDRDREGKRERERERDKNEKFNLSWSKNSIHHDNMFQNNINGSKSSNLNSSQLISYYNSTSKYFSHTFAEEKEKNNNENKLHDSLNNSLNYMRKPISPNKNERDFNNPINYFNKEIPFNTHDYQYENSFDNYSNKEASLFNSNSNSNTLAIQQEQQQQLNTLNQYQPLKLLQPQPQQQQQQQPMRQLNDNFTYNNSIDPYIRDNQFNQHQPNYFQNQQQHQQQQQQQQQQYHTDQQNQYYAYLMMQQLNNNNNQLYNQDNQQEQYTNFTLSQFQQQSLPLNQQNPKKLKKVGKKKGKKKSGEGSDKEEDYLLEMFGRTGWICAQCNNFNYETRNKCNRCGIQKTPKKLSEMKKKDSDEKKKKGSDRKGDWVCINCKNLNFSFRKVCNRCQIPKEQSDMMSGSGIPSSSQSPSIILPMNSFPCHFQMNLINNGQININYHNSQNNYNDENQNNNNTPNNEGEDEEGGEENF